MEGEEGKGGRGRQENGEGDSTEATVRAMEEEEEDPDEGIKQCLEQKVQAMSTIDIVQNCGTLEQGFKVFNQLLCSGGGVGSPGTGNGYWSSSSSGSGLRRSKRKKDIAMARTRSLMFQESEGTESEELLSLRSSSPCSDPSNKGGAGYGTGISSASGPEEEASPRRIKKVKELKGKAMLVELGKRYQEGAQQQKLQQLLKPKPKPKVMTGMDDFDIDGEDVLFGAVIQDFSQKQELLKENMSKVEKLSEKKFLKRLEEVKPILVDIYEGRNEPLRMQLYLANKHDQLRTMKKVVVHFSHWYSRVSDDISDLLFARRRDREKYADYLSLVAVPEAFVRIYANINDIDLEYAEKELLYGACYEGPAYTRPVQEACISQKKRKKRDKTCKMEDSKGNGDGSPNSNKERSQRRARRKAKQKGRSTTDGTDGSSPTLQSSMSR